MQFSRSHAWMLAVVSIFTGLVAPIGSYLWKGTPLPLTDKQWIAYVMLILLVVLFYSVSVGLWKKVRLVSYFIIGSIVTVFYLMYSDSLVNIRTWVILTDFSWGWIFLIAGTVMLLSTMVFEYEEYTLPWWLSDKIIWILWSVTLLILSGIIISISVVWPKAIEEKTILMDYFWTWNVSIESGITLSRAYESISHFSFDRKSNTIYFEWIDWDKKPIQNKRIYWLGNKKIEIQDNSRILKDDIVLSWSVIQVFDDDLTVLVRDGNKLIYITPLAEKTMNIWDAEILSIAKDASSKTIAWTQKDENGISLYKNGEQVWGSLQSIKNIRLSPSGYDIMVEWISLSGSHMVYKNGVSIHEFYPWEVDGSYISNWSHFAYITKDDGVYKMVYDGEYINGKYDQIREIFLEKSGNSYAYFGLPIGGKKYCLFTRYRGNICGLDGYMNPRLSADGGSVLYAGLKDGIWSIYRNTGIVVHSTGYTKTKIQEDYAFFDITNPRQFLFIEKNEDSTYNLRKNGKLLPERWKDIGLDVTFGYDNKIMMTARDDIWWRIIEF